MRELKVEEMKNIYAGYSFSTIFNSIIRGGNLFIEVGRYFGSSIRRLTTGNLCN